MDRSQALEQLPRAYSLALRLHELGATTELIADCLDVGPEAVGPLIEIALAKLAHIQRLIDLRDAAVRTATPGLPVDKETMT